tara:strand:- start:338 stop:1444 length:1107 start_codon:yes stop_codon:yes gene_type:complete
MPNFLFSSIEVLVGIGLLFLGGEFFVKGSVALSLKLGIPQLVIGLTVVSLGTSAPELFVSISSLLQGSDVLAVSNVVGSNIFNVLVVLGGSALVLPLKVESRLVRRDVPLLIAVSTAVWGMASAGKVTWQAGVALLIALAINTIWEIRTVREEPEETENAEPEINVNSTKFGWFYSLGLLVIGISLLTFGANLLVNGASAVASLLGVSEAVIGLTIVSAGTSMPELMTSLVAALKGRTDLAIGNVVGSSLLNQLLVLGGTAVVAGKGGLLVERVLINKDIPIMVLTTLACMPIFWTNGRISRQEGGILVALYIFYLIDQVLPKTIPGFQNEFRLVIISIILPILLVLITYQTINYWNKNRRGNKNFLK